MVIFRTRLAELLHEYQLDTSNCQERIGLPGATINRYVNGKRTPDIEKIMIIANAFDVSIDWLLGRTDERNVGYSGTFPELERLYSLATPELREVVMSLLQTTVKHLPTARGKKQ